MIEILWTYALNVYAIIKPRTVENSKSTYAIDYISKIIRAIGSQLDLLIIKYSSKKPLKMEFKLADAVKLLFYLAPRVQD
jgi:proliferating cell nuclear antigen